MVTGLLLLTLVLSVLLLAAFIYQIATTPLTAVDAPTLIRSAASPSAPAAALPVKQPRIPAATRPTPGTSPQGASRSQHPRATAALAIAGLAALTLGGWLFLHIAPGGAACSPNAIEVCSQGFVLLTGTQLAGDAIAVAGIAALVTAIVRAVR
jgi:hypothetical protein